jgi:hypothetical protein
LKHFKPNYLQQLHALAMPSHADLKALEKTTVLTLSPAIAQQI